MGGVRVSRVVLQGGVPLTEVVPKLFHFPKGLLK